MKTRNSALSLLLSLALLLAPLSAAPQVRAAEAPLALSVRSEAGKTTVTLSAAEPIAFSNYDAYLEWDDAFTLTAIANGQAALFPNFQSNVSKGMLSAASGGSNVTLNAGDVLAVFTLDGPDEGDHAFTLTVRDAANEDGDPLPWKGSVLTAAVKAESPAKAAIRHVGRDGTAIVALVSCTEAGAVIFCAAYKNSGQMVALESVSAVSDGQEHAYRLELGRSDQDFVRVFVLSRASAPLCASVRG